MGVLLSICKSKACLCIGLSITNDPKVLRLVNSDGKVLEFGSPVLVKDALINIAGSGIAATKNASQHLPPNHQLKIGKVYYVLSRADSSGSSMPSMDELENSGPRRIKLVITRQQLHQILNKQVSVEELLAGLENGAAFGGVEKSSSTIWKPKLETIHETVD